MLRFLTAGESHGPALVGILDGMRAGLPLLASDIDFELKRRQHGYGRGGRMKIEQDRVEILSGVRHGRTLASPIALQIANRDWANWQKAMAIEPIEIGDVERKQVTRPRPGHADLAGALKHDAKDARDILEPASARETTARVAVGAVCKKFLREFDVQVASHTVALGSAGLPPGADVAWDKILAAEGWPLRCADKAIEQTMIEEVDRARQARDSVVGSFQVVGRGGRAGLV